MMERKNEGRDDYKDKEDEWRKIRKRQKNK